MAGFVEGLLLSLGESLDRQGSSISHNCKRNKNDFVWRVTQAEMPGKKPKYNSTHTILSYATAKDVKHRENCIASVQQILQDRGMGREAQQLVE